MLSSSTSLGKLVLNATLLLTHTLLPCLFFELGFLEPGNAGKSSSFF